MEKTETEMGIQDEGDDFMDEADFNADSSKTDELWIIVEGYWTFDWHVFEKKTESY